MTKRADKPDFVHAPTAKPVRVAIIPLGAPLLTRSSFLPADERGPRPASRRCLPIWNCSGWRLPCRCVLRRPRCALTAPFHPYLIYGLAPEAIGGLLSVALFRVSPRMAVSHHPALWSPDFPRPRAAFASEAAIAWPAFQLKILASHALYGATSFSSSAWREDARFATVAPSRASAHEQGGFNRSLQHL
ncbi:hypothetical protein BPMI_02172 [Candidatus Burkholderia pumila]|uniref:Uncharacterized protein n=1 Tax=Candidatus Burkholderia pumila TaxID=1090375 RepID=A0ABR5HKL6_9BURK|nr:hypothetical protein BPMI_02172 [Candidatus Burkholderia pumila]